MENRTCPKLRGCLVISLWSEVVQESEGEKMSQFNKEKLDTLWLLQVSLKPKQKTDLKGIIYSSQPTSVEVPIFVSWRMYSYHNTNPWMEISVNFLESWPHPLLRSKMCIVRKYAFLIQRVKGLQVGWWRSSLTPCNFIFVLLGTTSSKDVSSLQVTSQSCLVSRGSKASWGCSSHLRVRAWWAASKELQCRAWWSPTQPCLIIRCVSGAWETVLWKAELGEVQAVGVSPSQMVG